MINQGVATCIPLIWCLPSSACFQLTLRRATELFLVLVIGLGDAGLTPTDCHSFVDLVCHIGKPAPGKVVSADVWVAAFLAHAIKWPPVVKYFSDLLQTDPLTGAESMVSLGIKCLLFADGKTWPSMFQRMNAGRASPMSSQSFCLAWLPASRSLTIVCSAGFQSHVLSSDEAGAAVYSAPSAAPS